jgi:GcrA cell cycle regulator
MTIRGYQRFDWTQERIEMLRKLWLDGWTITAIAQKLRAPRTSVSGKLNRLGLFGPGAPARKTGDAKAVAR